MRLHLDMNINCCNECPFFTTDDYDHWCIYKGEYLEGSEGLDAWFNPRRDIHRICPFRVHTPPVIPYSDSEEERKEIITNMKKYKNCEHFTIENIGTTHQPVIRTSCDHNCADENGIRPDDCPLFMTTSESRIYCQTGQTTTQRGGKRE